jgi:two-component system NtrC family sensor kinase
MDARIALPSIRLNGKEPLAWSAEETAQSSAFGRADRLAIVGQLAAGLAHEMNTPLGSISGHAEESLEVLEELTEGRLSRSNAEELRGRLLAIMRQANRCSRIATRLLQFAEATRPTVAECDAEQVMAEVLELIASVAQEKRVKINRHIADNLPAAPMGASEMEQLLINLLQNSLDASNSGGHITIEATVHERELLLTITDTGCGIPHEVLNRIFDPFFTTKPVGHGTGLGLSVCHGIVRRAGGSIEVQSAPGQGTRVTIALPLRGVTPQELRLIKASPLPLGGERNRPAESQAAGEIP